MYPDCQAPIGSISPPKTPSPPLGDPTSPGVCGLGFPPPPYCATLFLGLLLRVCVRFFCGERGKKRQTRSDWTNNWGSEEWGNVLPAEYSQLGNGYSWNWAAAQSVFSGQEKEVQGNARIGDRQLIDMSD